MSDKLGVDDNTVYDDEGEPVMMPMASPKQTLEEQQAEYGKKLKRADAPRRSLGEIEIADDLGPPPARAHEAQTIGQQIETGVNIALTTWVKAGEDVLQWAQQWRDLPPGSMDELSRATMVDKDLAERIKDGRGSGGALGRNGENR